MKVCDILLEVGGRAYSDERVAHGKQAQDLVIQDLQQQFGDEFVLLSTAPPGSRKPDIVAKIGENTYQFEVKHRRDKNAPMTAFNTTVRPDEPSVWLNMFARSLSGDEARDFNHLMDLHKEGNPSAGWPHEEQSPKSGSINVRTTDPAVISKTRRQLMRYLNRSNDDYFVVVNMATRQIDYYSIGTDNPLKAPGMPRINRVILKTDGAPYKNKMRIGIKIQLAK